MKAYMFKAEIGNHLGKGGIFAVYAESEKEAWRKAVEHSLANHILTNMYFLKIVYKGIGEVLEEYGGHA